MHVYRVVKCYRFQCYQTPLYLSLCLSSSNATTHMKKLLKTATSNVKTYEKQLYSNIHIEPQTLLLLRLY